MAVTRESPSILLQVDLQVAFQEERFCRHWLCLNSLITMVLMGDVLHSLRYLGIGPDC